MERAKLYSNIIKYLITSLILLTTSSFSAESSWSSPAGEDQKILLESQAEISNDDFYDFAGNSIEFNTGLLYFALTLALILLVLYIYNWKNAKKEKPTILQSMSNLKSIMDNVGEGVIITDHQGIIETSNTSAQIILGYKIDEYENRLNIRDLVRIFCNDGRIPVEPPLTQAFKQKHIICNEEPHQLMVTPAGIEYFISYKAIPLMDNNGKITHGIFIFKDLNDKIAIHDQLKHSQKLESVGRLAGGIAHDFNNMIGAISGTSEVMMLQLSEDDKMMRYLRRIFATAQKASELTNRLLDFTRKSSSSSNTSFNLSQIVEEALDIIERSMDPKVEVIADFNDKNCPMVGNASAIENMVINLCLNANDAMPDGGKLYISINNRDLDDAWCTKNGPELIPGKYAILIVQDTGIGIPSTRIKNIFEPFYTTKDIGKGSGLGLAAVYSTVSEHSGIIQVSSEPGEGSEFRIYFPLSCSVKIQESGKNNQQSQSAELMQSDLDQASGIILLADDEEFMRDAGRMMLESLGYEIMLAENGQKAVEMYERNSDKIDIVILDMVMPRMNGREAFKKIISINPEAKIIIASGFSREGKINSLFNEGLRAFVKKPYRQAEIAQILQNVLSDIPIEQV